MILEKKFCTSFEPEAVVAIGKPAKNHKFDLANDGRSIVAECKCYTWTDSGNVPSAKLMGLDEAVFYFSFLPAETKKILSTYKNDEVFISMQESDAAKSTRTATEYYNSLILQQTSNYDKAAELKNTIADYTDRITRLDAKKWTDVTKTVENELANTMSSAQGLYEGIRAHMEELFSSQMYTTYEDHSAAQGKEKSFLEANMKKIIIGGIAGAIIACGLWFLAGLIPEFSKGRKEKSGKEAAAK